MKAGDVMLQGSNFNVAQPQRSRRKNKSQKPQIKDDLHLV